MKVGLPGGTLGVSSRASTRRPVRMLYAGLDLSPRRLDVCLLDAAGELVEHTAAPPDLDGLRHLAQRLRGERLLPRALLSAGRRSVLRNGRSPVRRLADRQASMWWSLLVLHAGYAGNVIPALGQTTRFGAAGPSHPRRSVAAVTDLVPSPNPRAPLSRAACQPRDRGRR